MAFIPNLDPAVTVEDADEFVIRQGAEDKRLNKEILADVIINESKKNFWRTNQIVDGRLDIWYEGLSQTSSGYGSDTMFLNENVGTTKSHTRETLILGVDIPEVPSARWFSQTDVSFVAGAGNYDRKTHRIEGVQTSAGKTQVFSFYGRAGSAKDIAVEFVQNFGTGGSPSTEVTAIGVTSLTLSTSFVRYEVAVTLPSLSGKTIGTNGDDYLEIVIWRDAGSNFDARTNSLGHQSGTFDLACFQFEDGLVMTDFEELKRSDVNLLVNYFYTQGDNTHFNSTPSNNLYKVDFNTTMRAVPVVIRTGNGSITPSTAGTSLSVILNTGFHWDNGSNSSVGGSWSADARL